ncbi:MAG TPA: hypothetical protein VKS79_10875 [Gemmataceae bacterium]|nr:hypothetical protein [Gemmataceae bacterium]
MKFLMTARNGAGEIMRAEFEADDEAQARQLIQEADSSLELISLEPVSATEEASTDEVPAPAPSAPSGSGQNSYGKPAGCLGTGAIILIVLKVLVFGMRCTQDHPKQQQPFVPQQPIFVPGQQGDPQEQNQRVNRVLQRIAETKKLDDWESALRQRMQQTNDGDVRAKCRHALDEIAKLKAMPFNGSDDDEWEKQALEVRKAMAEAMPRNASAKGTAKITPGTAQK